MKESTLVAAEIQDLAAAVSEIAAAVKEHSSQNVVVKSTETLPNAYDVTITERDQNGYIVSFSIAPRTRGPVST